MRYLTAVLLMIGICSAVYAQTEKPKAKTAEKTVSDVVTNVFDKTNAFFQGRLEVTMAEDKDKYKNRKNYTINALGDRVPKTTIVNNKSGTSIE